MKELLCAAILVLTCMPAHSQVWEITTVASGSKPSLEFDASGNPHIAYINQSAFGWVRHAVWNPLTMAFDTSTVVDGNLEGPPALALDQNDVPHIVYHRHTQPPDQVIAYPVGPAWVNEDITDPNHDGWDNALAFDSNNRPHTSSVDPSTYPASTGVEYAWYDGASWHVEAIGSTLIDFYGGTSIALDSQDNPHITYYDDITGDLMYAVKDNGLWMIGSVETDGDAGRFASLELNSSDMPLISYYKHLSGSTGLVRLAEFNGVSWDLTTIDTLTEVDIGDARSITSLELDSGDEPHVSYGDMGLVKYGHRSGSEWEIEIVVDSSSGPMGLGHVTSLALDPQEMPGIVYYELGAAGIVKYAEKLTTTAVQEEDGLPSAYELKQNHPNPFNPTTTIEFAIPTSLFAHLSVYNLLGERVATLVGEELQAGTHIRTWDASGMPSGVYFYRLTAGEHRETRKMILSK